VEVAVADVGDSADLLAVHVAARRAAYREMLLDHFADSITEDGWLGWWEELIDSAELPRCGVLKLVDRGMLVGYISFGASEDDDADTTTGEVRLLHLHPSVWRRGGGSMLLRRACGSLRAGAFEDATLWVAAANNRARRFYQAQGWTPDGHEHLDGTEGRQRLQVRYRQRLVPLPASPDAASSTTPRY
jgi:GNAT superfamily N-acetyltransferase